MLMKMLCYLHCYLRLVNILCLWVKGSQVPQYDTILTDRAWRSESLTKFFSRVRCPWLGVHCAPPPQQENAMSACRSTLPKTICRDNAANHANTFEEVYIFHCPAKEFR